MDRKTSIAAFLLLVVFAAPATAQTAPPDDAKLAPAIARIHEFVNAQMELAGTPGMALAITSRDRLLHVATFGYADIKTKAPVTPETLFEIGSISKSFTAMALMQLREQGKLDPQQPIEKVLPWFTVPTKFEPITVHHLLTHTSGIPRDRDMITGSPYQAAGVRELWTGYPPGRRYAYSNIGYQILGYLVEELAARPYGDVIRERILMPAGMMKADAVITHDTRKRMAVGYRRFYDDRPAHESHPLVEATWLEYGGGDGSIAATPADLAAYARLILNRGAVSSNASGPRVISKESFALMTACGIRTGPNDCYGYGLSIRQADGRTVISHGGGMVGYSTMLLADMDAGIGVVTMVNGPGNPGGAAEFALRAIRAALAGQPLPDVPQAPQPTRVANAADYAGTFTRADGRKLDFVADENELALLYGGDRIVLERRGRDAFYVHHPDFALFILRFGRQDGRVVEASFGADWYVNDRYTGPKTFDTPADWTAYPGHYRSYSPWLSNFRVVLRKGRLYYMGSGGGEIPLVPLPSTEQNDPGWFQVGEGETAERVRFDAVVRGQATRATVSGAEFYRTFTP